MREEGKNLILCDTYGVQFFLEEGGSIYRIAVNMHLPRIKIHNVWKIIFDIIMIYRVNIV